MRLLLIVAVIVVANGLAWGETEEPTVYGKSVELGETVTVADLLLRPDSYVDQVVRVEGVITDVDLKAGSWIDISTKSGTRTVRFEVGDADIIFPADIKGRRTFAEGRLRKRKPDDDLPTVVYVIEGTGAVVH